VSQDIYRVVLTLTKSALPSSNLSFESGVAGDSFIQFTKPEKERSDSEPNEIAVFYAHNNDRIELRGTPNAEGRLGKIIVEMPASCFAQAENAAFGAASPFLSSLSFELDVPLRVGQMDVTQLSTGNASMTDVHSGRLAHLTISVSERSSTPRDMLPITGVPKGKSSFV
jgi:hypothetical protein